ncbi:MAG: hypothetical protein J2O48_02020 [Solirubrobacterales bacterium]|nr:hypothetical protein [Solirubrobacterales bacterium]
MSRLSLGAAAVLGTALVAAAPAAATTSHHASPASGLPPLLHDSPLTPGTPSGKITPKAHAGKATQSTSPHWVGYATTGAGPYKSVSSSWTQPSVDCSKTPNAYSSFWVGLDGDSTNTVEQTGADADCSNGSGKYYGWYEMYPAAPVNYDNPVSPGDQMSATVNTDGNGNFTLTLKDNTQGWTKTTNQSGSNYQLGSAEVVGEAPQDATTGDTLPLADFSKAHFNASTVNGQSLASESGLDPITLVNSSGTTLATPGGIGNDGDFDVNWEHQ